MNSLLELQPVTFPEPTDININMMPFVMGNPFSIPKEFGGYLPLIEACDLEQEQIGKVGYLSISESLVSAGTAQRRPGIHTEKHPGIDWGGGWGRGSVSDRRRDGIYMASNVPDSCRVWNLEVAPGAMGDCEHLRHALETVGAISTQASTLYWMTDSCPHESLQLTSDMYRQWFRLVTHKVSLWYENHSTANRLGFEPDCGIVKGDKFACQQA